MAIPTPEFKKRPAREMKLFVREARDGCVDCREQGTCRYHIKIFVDLALHPRKYINLDGVK